jgi:hypothetical protein
MGLEILHFAASRYLPCSPTRCMSFVRSAIAFGSDVSSVRHIAAINSTCIHFPSMHLLPHTEESVVRSPRSRTSGYIGPCSIRLSDKMKARKQACNCLRLSPADRYRHPLAGLSCSVALSADRVPKRHISSLTLLAIQILRIQAHAHRNFSMLCLPGRFGRQKKEFEY